MSDDYRIVAVPSLRVVSPGAKITYRLERRNPNAKPVDRLSCMWFCVNDPAGVAWYEPKRVGGPFGPAEWRDAEWEFTGRHRIVCHVNDGDSKTDFTYDQEVAALPAVLAMGPTLPLESRDPDAALDGASRKIELINALAKDEPPSEALRERHEDQLAEIEQYRDKLAERLRVTRGARRYPVRAQHFSVEAQKWLTLDVFAAEAGGKWWIVDWTNAAVRRLTGEYDGSGATPEAALRDALDTWDEDNRYPDGIIRYEIANVPGAPTISGSFDTDGSSFWDSIASFFTWVGIGAAATAAAIMFLSPVPGPQALSVAIWASIFSSTAAATINIGQRAAEGFSSWRANAFDVLTIVGNMFGVAGVLWARGAQITAQLGPNILKAVLIGQVTTDGVQGVLIGVEHVSEIDGIRKNPSLTPKEKVDRILEVCRSLALNGLLVYINVKGTKADLDNLNLKPKHIDGESPAQALKRLGDPTEHIDLTQKKPVAEGHTADGDHTTTVHLDQEGQPLHAGGRGTKVRPKTRNDQLREAMTHKQYSSHLPWAQAMKARPEFAHLSLDELIALRGYTGNEKWVAGLEDYKRINTALRSKDAEQLALLKVYIEEASSALRKMPKYSGLVERKLELSRKEVLEQFVEGGAWTTPGFMSTTAAPATFPGNVTIIAKSKSGARVKDVSVFPSEDEVLFAPGTAFTIYQVEETAPNTFTIWLVQR